MNNRKMDILIGMFFGINLLSILTDLLYLFLGREKYFIYYEESFINPSKTLPYHIFLGVIIIYFLMKTRKK